ncbi:MAG TPA: maleylacetoacetate isomerase [Haliangium sp.]|nr:maleylacetoacetate isomerase [Haliangium sp.]
MMKLYSYWRSTSSWRVRIALHWKGIAHEIVPVHLLEGGGQQHQADYLARNPMAQVPLLELDQDGQRIGQSMAILAYLEERFPEPALLPGDPYLRARARQLAELVVSGIQPLQNLSVTQYLDAQGQDSKAWLRHWVGRGIRAFEETSRATRGSFCVGDQVSWADLCLIPQLYSARRFGVDLSEVPALLAIEERCQATEAFRRAGPDQQVDAPAPL